MAGTLAQAELTLNGAPVTTGEDAHLAAAWTQDRNWMVADEPEPIEAEHGIWLVSLTDEHATALNEDGYLHLTWGGFELTAEMP